MQPYLLMFVIAAVLGTLYDLIHVRYGVLSYANPHVFGTSYWVPLEFGCAALVGIAALKFLSKKLELPQVSPARAVADAALLAVGYFVTGMFAGNNALTFALLGVIAAVAIGTRPTRFVIVGSLVAAVVGPLGEIFMSQVLGFFHYNVAAVVPYWLPLLWVIAGGLFIDIPVLLLKKAW